MKSHKISCFGIFGLILVSLINFIFHKAVFMKHSFLSLLVSELRMTLQQAILRTIIFSCVAYLIVFIEMPYLRAFKFPPEIEMPLLVASMTLLLFFAWILFVKDVSEALEKIETKIAQEKLKGGQKN